MGVKISYGITVCNESMELRRLLKHLSNLIDNTDEVLVLVDHTNSTDDVYEVIKFYRGRFENFVLLETSLNGDFAKFKNKLIEHASGDFIIQLDADEIPNIFLIENIKSILKINPDIDCYYIPRINVVKGIGLSHVQKWGWNISKLEGWLEEDTLDLDNPKDRDRYELYKKYDLIIEEDIFSK